MELPLWVEWMALKMLTPGLLGMWGVITEWRTSNKTISKADNSAENCPEGWRCTPWRHLYFLSQQGKMLQILANGTFLLLVFSFCSQHTWDQLKAGLTVALWVCKTHLSAGHTTALLSTPPPGPHSPVLFPHSRPSGSQTDRQDCLFKTLTLFTWCQW